MFTNTRITDMIADEAMLVAFSYNVQEPRFYSKYAADLDPKTYDVTMALAVQASASTPIFFRPKEYVNGHGLHEILVDGNVIAQNPSLYAFILASHMRKK